MKGRHPHYRVYVGAGSPDRRLRYPRLPRYLLSPQSGPAPPQAGFLLRPQLHEVHLDKCTQMVGRRQVQPVSLPIPGRLCRKHQEGHQIPYHAHAQSQMRQVQTHSCLLHNHSSSFVSVGCPHLFPDPDPDPLVCFLHNPQHQPSHLHPMPSLQMCHRCSLRRLPNSLSMTLSVSSSEVLVRLVRSSRAGTEYFPKGTEKAEDDVFGVGRGDKWTLTSW